jgi:hypothetical protein
MKTVSADLKAHLAQPVTKLAKCIKITRTDGTVVALTEHDQDLADIPGYTDITFLASPGIAASAITTDLTLAVNNAEAWGFFDNTILIGTELASGKYDFAAFEIFCVHWANLTQGIIRLGSGTFGEVVITPQNTFLVELRGLTQAFTTEIGEVFSPICRADLGDSRCKFPVQPAAWTPLTPVNAGTLAAGNPYYVSDPAPADDLHKLAIYICVVAGTTAATPPAFDPAVGALTVEGTGVQWQSIQPTRGVATVASVVNANQAFTTTSALIYRDFVGNITATVVFVANTVSIAINVSDGVTLTVFTLADGENPATAAADLAGQINGSGMLLTAVADNATVSIQKTADTNSGYVNLFSGSSSIAITSFADDYFKNGYVTWKTGLNAGLSMDISGYLQANTGGELLILFMNMPFPIHVGDVFYYAPGCDKRMQTCFLKFNNSNNRRAEDFLPGLDQLFNYPEAA